MKTNAKELFEVVRMVVRDEVSKILPQVVREHLTETYIKKMVLEASAKGVKKSGLAELLAPISREDEDHVPSPISNSDLGIYNADNMTKKDDRPTNEGVRKLRESLGPIAFVLDDVKADEGETQGGFKFKEEIAPEFERMNKLVELVESKQSKPMQVSPEAKMRELEMKRKALDVPVSNIRKSR